LPTHFGKLSFSYGPKNGGGELNLSGSAAPPGGFVVALPAAAVQVEADGKPVAQQKGGRVVVPAGTKRVTIQQASLADKPTETDRK
jgi:hypothetical protein